MTALVALVGLVAVVTAVRSTWSPCGLSMLSTVTPLSENARGHRYAVTASWFVFGGVLGGITLGLLGAALAAVVAVAGLSVEAALALAATAAVVAAAHDLRVGGFRLPAHRRQVDEVWLTGFRPWVYGVGFGWQIGVGLATYITTAGVYLLVVLSALAGTVTAGPLLAFGAGVLFGTVRGLAVLLGARLDNTAALRAMHARLDAWDAPAAWITSAVLVLTAAIAAAAVEPWAGAVVAIAFVPVLALRFPRSTETRLDTRVVREREAQGRVATV